MKHTIEIEYNIGDTVILNNGVECKIIGYNYVEGKGIQYCVMYELEWKWFYSFELTKKGKEKPEY